MRLKMLITKRQPFFKGEMSWQEHNQLCYLQVDGFVQERYNSSVLAMELQLSCTNPSKCAHIQSENLILPMTPFTNID